MRKIYFIFILFFLACTASRYRTDSLFLALKNWPKPNYNFNENKLTIDKIHLGRALFYDPILSRDGTISCSNCHNPYNSFAHVGHALSHGIEDRIGTRNAPALINLAWSKLYMWDGAIHHLDAQPLAPITHPKEMDENMSHVLNKLSHSTLYPSLYYLAYGDSLINSERTLKAISAFVLTLVSSHSKYDSVKSNLSFFTDQEMNGYKLFKRNCNSCHIEPLFTSGGFENNGLRLDPKLVDLGRVKISLNPLDSFKFKVPTLRNIEFTSPYMHDGRFKRLADVIRHYTTGLEHNPSLASQLKDTIILSPNEQVDLITFLLTLSDRSFLFNPAFAYPKYILKSTEETP